jgi:glycosyltransferase involved in cell wall biosynthesis
LVLPLPSSAVARRINRQLLIVQTRRALGQLPPQRQLWSFTADAVPLVRCFGERVVVYYCVDEFAAFPGYDVATTRRLDQRFCEAADLVITTSQGLYQTKRQYNANTLLVPHGVLYESFARALDPHFPVAAELRSLPRPIIGYYGLLHDWQDYDLLAGIARQRPDWSLVLVGKVQTNTERFATLRNVHFIGQRPHATLPSYCRGFDVAIIPHRINELTRNMNPIKLREYLAAGLPVVASDLPEVRAYEPEVRIAEGVSGWIRALETAVGDRSPAADRRRSALVADDDWSVRVRTITQHVAKALTTGRTTMAANGSSRRPASTPRESK